MELSFNYPDNSFLEFIYRSNKSTTEERARVKQLLTHQRQISPAVRFVKISAVERLIAVCHCHSSIIDIVTQHPTLMRCKLSQLREQFVTMTACVATAISNCSTTQTIKFTTMATTYLQHSYIKSCLLT